MAEATSMAPVDSRRRRVALVPRLKDQGYAPDQVEKRRRWVEEKTGSRLEHVGATSLPTEEMRGNIENPIGAAQMPLAVAGPLLICGEHAEGTFYVPLATTEGALVRSYERGMVALTRSGGASARVWIDENRVAPVFFLEGVAEAHDFAARIRRHEDDLREAAESTTSHGRLLRVECLPVGREVIVSFCYSTGDAQGMNMIVKASHEACLWIQRHLGGPRYYIFSGYNSEKRASGSLLAGGKGKKVTAGARLPRKIVKSVLHSSPERLVDMWHHTVLGHMQAGALGYNGHYANGLTALFIACGQDVANVANAAVGITNLDLTPDGDLYASVTLPSLTVATVGGGTGLGTSHECLEMLGCAGGGHARKLAEIVAATVLAGELSMGGAIGSGEFVEAHELYGRNRPEAAGRKRAEETP
ncbi:MAG: hydroxymethylglutaryl-CoA reductase [bacterium]|nr:hydroxymethylglutaryl-CoA reductase [bacterium]